MEYTAATTAKIDDFYQRGSFKLIQMVAELADDTDSLDKRDRSRLRGQCKDLNKFLVSVDSGLINWEEEQVLRYLEYYTQQYQLVHLPPRQLSYRGQSLFILQSSSSSSPTAPGAEGSSLRAGSAQVQYLNGEWQFNREGESPRAMLGLGDVINDQAVAPDRTFSSSEIVRRLSKYLTSTQIEALMGMTQEEQTRLINVESFVNAFPADPESFQSIEEKDQPGGYASLDETGKISSDLIPVVGQALNYQAQYNAATNLPALPGPSNDNRGHLYIVKVAGAQSFIENSIALNPGDWVISDGTNWEVVPISDFIGSPTGGVNAFGVARVNQFVLDTSSVNILTLNSNSNDSISTILGMEGVSQKTIIISASSNEVRFRSTFIPVSQIIGKHVVGQRCLLTLFRVSSTSENYYAIFQSDRKVQVAFDSEDNRLAVIVDGVSSSVQIPVDGSAPGVNVNVQGGILTVQVGASFGTATLPTSTPGGVGIAIQEIVDDMDLSEQDNYAHLFQTDDQATVIRVPEGVPEGKSHTFDISRGSTRLDWDDSYQAAYGTLFNKLEASPVGPSIGSIRFGADNRVFFIGQQWQLDTTNMTLAQALGDAIFSKHESVSTYNATEGRWASDTPGAPAMVAGSFQNPTVINGFLACNGIDQMLYMPQVSLPNMGIICIVKFDSTFNQLAFSPPNNVDKCNAIAFCHQAKDRASTMFQMIPNNELRATGRYYDATQETDPPYLTGNKFAASERVVADFQDNDLYMVYLTRQGGQGFTWKVEWVPLSQDQYVFNSNYTMASTHAVNQTSMIAIGGERRGGENGEVDESTSFFPTLVKAPIILNRGLTTQELTNAFLAYKNLS